MKIAILGSVCHDEIVTHLGERKTSYGGILYNVAALESIVDDQTQLLPIAHVGYDRYEEIVALFEAYRGTTTAGLRRMEERPNPAVKLVYESVSKRSEALLHVPPPLSDEQLALASDCDAILVNFITGKELVLLQMQELAAAAEGHVHMDVHNKISTWLPEGGREYVGLPDWRDWFACCDTVQMNEFEIELVLGQRVRTSSEYLFAARELLETTRTAAMITLGPLGSVLAYVDASDGRARGCAWPAAELGDVQDTTGCGDSFSAGFIWHFLRSGDPIRANAAANIVGGVNCATPGIGNLSRAREMEALLPEAFPTLMQQLDEGWRGDRL